MKLPGLDVNDNSWRVLSDWLSKDIERLRTGLETEADPDIATELRGQLRMARRIQDLPISNVTRPIVDPPIFQGE